MRKYIIIFILSFILILLSLLGLKYYYEVVRYSISAPMEDIEYKKAIIRDSKNITYKLENLRPIAGETELTRFIRQNDKNPNVYSIKPENLKKGNYRANFHIHTTNSDGIMTVKERLDEAQNYAQNHIKDGYMYIALTDHNTVLGSKEIIKVLQKYPARYKNIKIIPGIEISSLYWGSKYADYAITSHILAWCINPYDEFLNKAFYKKDLKDKWNKSMPDWNFDEVIPVMSKYGIVGVAHPARYVGQLGPDIYPYMTEMLDRYAKLGNKVHFVEGYYQTYKDDEKNSLYGGFEKFSKFINSEAQKRGIVLTGSTDAHGVTIFGR